MGEKGQSFTVKRLPFIFMSKNIFLCVQIHTGYLSLICHPLSIGKKDHFIRKNSQPSRIFSCLMFSKDLRITVVASLKISAIDAATQKQGFAGCQYTLYSDSRQYNLWHLRCSMQMTASLTPVPLSATYSLSNKCLWADFSSDNQCMEKESYYTLYLFIFLGIRLGPHCLCHFFKALNLERHLQPGSV